MSQKHLTVMGKKGFNKKAAGGWGWGWAGGCQRDTTQEPT